MENIVEISVNVSIKQLGHPWSSTAGNLPKKMKSAHNRVNCISMFTGVNSLQLKYGIRMKSCFIKQMDATGNQYT